MLLTTQTTETPDTSVPPEGSVDPDDATTPDEPTTPNEPSTPDEPPASDTDKPTPSITLKSYDCIDENSQYLGAGTKEDPRYYLAKKTEDYSVKISGKFLNEAKANGIYFYIALRH